MARLPAAAQTVLPVLFMLGLGAVFRQTRLFSEVQVAGLKKLVLHVTLPAVLFHSFARAQYSADSLIWPSLMFLACLGAMALGRAGARVMRLSSGLVPYLTSGYEAGMLGYALFALLVGEEQVASFAIIDLGQVLFVFTVYKVSLDRSQGGPRSGNEVLRSLLFSPLILAIVAGVLMGATGAFRELERTGVAQVLSSTASFIAQPTAAVVLLAVGYDLVLRDIHWRDTLKIAGLRWAISGLLMAVMLAASRWFLHGDPFIRRAIVLMFLLPPPYVLPMFAKDPAERTVVSSGLSLLTLFAIVAFAAMTMWGG